MKTKRVHQNGFTLVELLISLGILGLLLAAVVSVNIGTSRSAAGLQARNDLQPELQLTQNYMASKLAQASYIFQPGANIQMTSTGDTTKNYANGPTGNYNWVVGTDPIIAFIVPPKTVTAGGCVAGAAATPSTASTYCYAFYAFYTMNRANYLAAVTGADDPGTNVANDATAAVLMEYRGYYSSIASYGGSSYSTSAIDIPTGNRGRLLMDFVAPSSATFPLFSTNAPANPASQAPGVTTVTMNLAALQSVAQQIIRVPAGTTTTYSTLTVYPRNVGKTQLSN